MAQLIDGLVLCHVGDHRLAVRAQDVDAFEHDPLGATYVGERFGDDPTPPEGVRVLRCGAQRLAVDRLDVHGGVALLPAPPLLSSAFGGGILGFVEVRQLLWPVVIPERL